MLPAAEVTHLGPVFEASRALDHWIAGHCPDSLYVGTFWALCLSPLVLAMLAVAVRPARPRGRGRPPLFLALILGALLLARLPLMCYDRFNPDEAFLLASAMRVPFDPVAYRSFDAMTSGPLNVYVQSIPAWFGAPLTYVTSRLTGTLLVFGTLAFLWLTYRRILGERAGSLALMPSFCFYFFAWDADFTHCSSEHVAIFLSAAALCLLAGEYRAANAPGLWRIALAGIVAGSMLFAKLQALPVEAAILAIAAVLAWRKSRRTAALVALAGGAALVPAAFLAMFQQCGVLPYFWITYFRKNVAYTGAASSSAAGRIESAWNLLFHLSNLGAYELALLAVWAAGLATAAALVKGGQALPPAQPWWSRPDLRPPAELALASWLLLAAGFTAVAAPGREFMHYELFLVLPSGLVTASSFLWIRTWFRLQTHAPRAAVRLERPAVACFVLFTCLVPTALRAHIDDAWDAGSFSAAAPLPTAIRRYASDRDTVVVWGWRSGLYVASGRAPGTRFADSLLQIEPAAYQQYYRDVYLSDFRRSKPALFVDAVGPGGFTYTDRSQAGYETFEELRQTVARDYHQAAEIDGVRLFVRNDRARLLGPPLPIPPQFRRRAPHGGNVGVALRYPAPARFTD
jgi:hypothetical protein